MAEDIRYSNAAVNAEVDALTALLDGGYLRLYSGMIPTDADAAISSQTLLAELRFDTPAFGAAVAGVATSNNITQNGTALATGTVTWFRALESNGTTVVIDGTAGTSNANLVLSSVSIETGATVTVSSMTLTQSKSGS